MNTVEAIILSSDEDEVRPIFQPPKNRKKRKNETDSGGLCLSSKPDLLEHTSVADRPRGTACKSMQTPICREIMRIISSKPKDDNGEWLQDMLRFINLKCEVHIACDSDEEEQFNQNKVAELDIVPKNNGNRDKRLIGGPGQSEIVAILSDVEETDEEIIAVTLGEECTNNSQESDSSSGTDCTGDSSVCTQCGKTFATKFGLRQHMPVHTGVKQFKCKNCGKLFNQKANLERHKKKVEIDDTRKCKKCNKTFCRLLQLKRHMTTFHSPDTSEMPYKCPVCSKGFDNSTHYKHHLQQHSTEVLFMCDKCGKAFDSTSKLKSHMTSHKSYKCTDCGRGFHLKRNLVQHRATLCIKNHQSGSGKEHTQI